MNTALVMEQFLSLGYFQIQKACKHCEKQFLWQNLKTTENNTSDGHIFDLSYMENLDSRIDYLP